MEQRKRVEPKGDMKMLKEKRERDKKRMKTAKRKEDKKMQKPNYKNLLLPNKPLSIIPTIGQENIPLMKLMKSKLLKTHTTNLVQFGKERNVSTNFAEP